MSVLVYVDHIIADKLPKNHMIDLSTTVDHDRLKNLQPDTSGLYPLIVATDVCHMRGVDYRCDQGICLIIAKSFENHRDSVQGQQRVGRFGDHCERYINPNLKLVDEEK